MLPKRFVDPESDCGPDSVRLVETKHIGEPKSLYTTLSYCLASPKSLPPLKTTEKTFEGLTVARLPKTDKDDIAASRNLGVHDI